MLRIAWFGEKIDQKIFWNTLPTLAPKNFRWRQWGAERECRISRHGSEDPHRRQWKFFLLSVCTAISTVATAVSSSEAVLAATWAALAAARAAARLAHRRRRDGPGRRLWWWRCCVGGRGCSILKVKDCLSSMAFKEQASIFPSLPQILKFVKEITKLVGHCSCFSLKQPLDSYYD